MAVVTPTAKAQFIDAAGIPLAGGLLYTYAAGTTTPQATYTDSTAATANSNPIVLDSRGEANIWLGSATYKFKLCDSTNTEIWTVDNISAPTSGLSPVLSGNVTISSTSSGPALSITQSGTGAILKVPDPTNPAVTLFTIDNTGQMGIGTASPGSAIDLAGGGLQISSSGGTARSKVYADATNSYYTAEGTRAAVITANSTNLIYADSSGFVGIKNAAPTVALDVTGALKTSGAITGGTSISSGTTLASGTTLTAGSSLSVTTSASIGTTLSVDTIAEKTSSAGVTVNNTLKADTISGKTSSTSMTLAGISISSSIIDNAARPISAGTAQNTTSGTVINFTGIPSWVRRVVLMIQGVSLSGTGQVGVRLGTSSGFVSSGYTGGTSSIGASTVITGSISTGFEMTNTFASASNAFSGAYTISLLGSNIWVCTGAVGVSSGNIIINGHLSLGGTLTQVQLYSQNGSDTFDAGSANILYE